MQSQARTVEAHQAQHLEVVVNHTGYQASYLDIGNGQPLLMLHGFMGSKRCWLPLMEGLQSQFRCISLDLLGFGESSKPELRYDVALEVAFVRQVIDALKIDPCYILGHSFGGWVASAYALAYPHGVKGLMLAAPAGIRDDSFCGRYDALRPLLWKTPLVDWVLQGVKPVASLAGKRQEFEQIWQWRRELMAQPVARSFLESRMRPEDAVDTVEKQIYQLRIPTLVIAAECDDTIPLWHCETYAKGIPGAQLEILAGADHDLIRTQAAKISQLIVHFLKQPS